MSEAARDMSPDLASVLRAARTLAARLGIDRSEPRMAEQTVETLSTLFPDFRIAVRTVQSTTRGVIASASSADPTGDVEQLAIRRADWGADAPPKVGATLTDEYVPLFEGCVDGRAIPLMAGEALVGLVNIEAARSISADEIEIAAGLTELLAAAVRDRRLSRDARYLRRWLATTIDNANALIFVVDSNRTVTLCNRALASLLGVAHDRILDTDVLDWISERQRGVAAKRIAAALQGQSVNGLELMLKRDDGDMVSTIFNMARPADVEGAVVAIGQDVTAVRLLEDQVVQAEKLASLGQLAAGVVHEINNPLTSITVYADYLLKKLQDRGSDASELSMLEKILDGSNRILKFTRDLVDYGKPSGSERDVMSLNEVVQQSVSFCEHVLDRAGADLTLELARDLPPLYGVRDQFQQVIINLLTNACHALGPAGGNVKVVTRDQGGRMLAVEITDDGNGIPVRDLPLIFEPFFTTKTPGEGTGLGLSIVKKIIDFHNGRILVESEEGKGTTFCIHLPTGHAE